MQYRITQLLLVMITFSIILRCDQSKTQSNVKPEDTSTADVNSGIEDAIPNIKGLSGMGLDNGKKWEMDEHTRSSFKKMVDSFDSSNLETVSGLNQSGEQLNEQVGDLIQGCTMDGDAHNQLHAFLTGYIPAVDSLSTAITIESGKKHAIKVKKYLNRYSNYFE